MRQTREISHLWRKRRKGRHRNGALKIKLCDKRKGSLRERIQDDRRWFIVRAENLVEELEEEAKHSGSIEEERINTFFSATTHFIYIHRCKSPLVSTRCFCAGDRELPKYIELTRRQTGMETALIKGKSRNLRHEKRA